MDGERETGKYVGISVSDRYTGLSHSASLHSIVIVLKSHSASLRLIVIVLKVVAAKTN